MRLRDVIRSAIAKCILIMVSYLYFQINSQIRKPAKTILQKEVSSYTIFLTACEFYLIEKPMNKLSVLIVGIYLFGNYW